MLTKQIALLSILLLIVGCKPHHSVVISNIQCSASFYGYKPEGIVVEGVISNSCSETFDLVGIQYDFFDSQGRRLDQGLDNLSDVPPGMVVTFKVSGGGEHDYRDIKPKISNVWWVKGNAHGPLEYKIVE